MKIGLLLFWGAIFLIDYALARAMNAREMAVLNKLDTLLRRWKRARKHRECWLKRYESIIPNARLNPEYLRLWDCEIGNEILLNIEIGSSLEISYDDFKAERRALQQQE